jgi:hypothetical protein
MRLTDLFRVTDAEGHSFVTTDGWFRDEPGYTIEDSPVLTAREIAQYLDEDAESANYHQLVGAHVWLVGLVEEAAGADVALKVIGAIFERGGIHEFS